MKVTYRTASENSDSAKNCEGCRIAEDGDSTAVPFGRGAGELAGEHPPELAGTRRAAFRTGKKAVAQLEYIDFDVLEPLDDDRSTHPSTRGHVRHANKRQPT